MVPEPGNNSQQGNGSHPNSNQATLLSTNGTMHVGSDNSYLHQMMITSNPSLLSQHQGNQNQMMYQNSLLDVAGLMNPLQILPPVGAPPTNVNVNMNMNNLPTVPTSANNNLLSLQPSTNNNAIRSNTAPQNINLQNGASLLCANHNPPPVPYPNMQNQAPATTLGGVRIPPVPPNASTAQQVQIAAAAAAAEAAPPKGYHGPIPGGIRKRDLCQIMDPNDIGDSPANKRGKRNSTSAELTEEEKKQLNRDRNRQHARSTRLRKKAYVNKLKELVDGLHAERSEEVRKRRVAVQHLADVQMIRRKVITTFLQFHAGYEPDPRKWETILEDGFYLKQPLTPFRSFRTVEIDQSRDKDCRISIGIESIIRDSASMAVMIDSVGFRSSRWQHIKKDDFLCREEGRTGKVTQRMPGSIVRQNVRFPHAISSLSSGSDSYNGNGSDEERKKQKLMLLNRQTMKQSGQNQTHTSAKKVSSSSSGASSSLSSQGQNNDFHDYHAQPLPDPRLDGGSTDSDSHTNASDNAVVGKNLCTDSSSSGEDEKTSKKLNVPPNVEILSKRGDIKVNTQLQSISATRVESLKPPNTASAVIDPSVSSNNEVGSRVVKPVVIRSALPPNIARTGGISHNIRPVAGDLNSRLNTAPAVPLPPFAGIGKRATPGVSSVIPVASSNTVTPSNRSIQPTVPTPQISNYVPPKSVSIVSKGTTVRNETNSNGVSSTLQQAVVIDPDNGTTSSDESLLAVIQAHYHINEDDMLITDNVLMCPFIFRTQDAVLCGALAECVMPGMLRAEFSERNKLKQLEMVYDAMGFMQQLERASGNEGNAHIIPNSLETSVQPNAEEARVITSADPPYLIVSVNKLWTRTTKYTQMDVEQKELSLLHGKRTDKNAGRRAGRPPHDYSIIKKGHPACCTNIYYDKFGRDFIAFVSSYPVANNEDETTHILHVFKVLEEKEDIHFS